MRSLFYLLLLICEFSFAQESTDIRRTMRLDDDDDCFESQLVFISDTAFHWSDMDPNVRDMEISLLKDVKKHFKSKTRYTQAIEDYLCIEVAEISEGDSDLGTLSAALIYEFCFEYDFQINNILKSVKKYKVNGLDWPNTTIEARFYKSDKSLFLFLDGILDGNSPGFKKLTDKFIEALKQR